MRRHLQALAGHLDLIVARSQQHADMDAQPFEAARVAFDEDLAISRRLPWACSRHRYRGRDQPTRHQETAVQLGQRRLAVFADAVDQPLRRKLAPGSIVRRASSKPSQRPVSGYYAL